jgi:hypothetical protein
MTVTRPTHSTGSAQIASAVAALIAVGLFLSSVKIAFADYGELSSGKLKDGCIKIVHQPFMLFEEGPTVFRFDGAKKAIVPDSRDRDLIFALDFGRPLEVETIVSDRTKAKDTSGSGVGSSQLRYKLKFEPGAVVKNLKATLSIDGKTFDAKSKRLEKDGLLVKWTLPDGQVGILFEWPISFDPLVVCNE